MKKLLLLFMLSLVFLLQGCNPKIDKFEFYTVEIDGDSKGFYRGESLSYQGDLFCIYDKLHGRYTCYDYKEIKLEKANWRN